MWYICIYVYISHIHTYTLIYIYIYSRPFGDYIFGLLLTMNACRRKEYFLIVKVIWMSREGNANERIQNGKIIHLSKPGEVTSKASLVVAGFKGSFHFTMWICFGRLSSETNLLLSGGEHSSVEKILTKPKISSIKMWSCVLNTSIACEGLWTLSCMPCWVYSK